MKRPAMRLTVVALCLSASIGCGTSTPTLTASERASYCQPVRTLLTWYRTNPPLATDVRGRIGRDAMQRHTDAAWQLAMVYDHIRSHAPTPALRTRLLRITNEAAFWRDESTIRLDRLKATGEKFVPVDQDRFLASYGLRGVLDSIETTCNVELPPQFTPFHYYVTRAAD